MRCTHQIEEYGVVDEVILSGLHVRRRGEVHAEMFTHLFNVVPGPGQTDYLRMEFSLGACKRGDTCEVLLE
jgi:hypothetical protein